MSYLYKPFMRVMGQLSAFAVGISSSEWSGTGLYMRPELGILATSRGRGDSETGWLTQSVRAIPC